jgi:hypothetical protein
MVGPGKNKKMIAYATYCSAQKNYSKKPAPAIELYDSDRISEEPKRKVCNSLRKTWSSRAKSGNKLL